MTEADGSPGEWHLRLFAPEQPDFNWGSPDVRREFEDVLRFWFDRGVDGIRIDSAALLCKDAALPDVAADALPGPAHPYSDRIGAARAFGQLPALAAALAADGPA